MRGIHFGAAFALLVLLLAPARARAHDPFEITTDAHIAGAELRLHTTLSLLTAGRMCLPERGRAPLLPADFPDARAALERCARDFFQLAQAGVALPARAARLALTPEDDLDITTFYARPTRSPLVFDAIYLRKLSNPSAGVVLTVTGERAFLGQQLLRPDEPTLAVSLEPDAASPAAGAARATPPSFAQFLALGVRHILTGYDHLLFLLGLLIACRTLRAALGVVTCFTLAHSVTLALAGLGIVTLGSRIVEPAIAATIVFVGIENLRPGTTTRGRYLLTFAFGLLHGFGFAMALREIGLGRNGAPILLPLFGFNLGVEVGQIAVAAVALPILWRLRRVPLFARRGDQAISVLLCGAGLLWFVQRLL